MKRALLASAWSLLGTSWVFAALCVVVLVVLWLALSVGPQG